MSETNNKVLFISIIGEQDETLFNSIFGDVDKPEMEFSAYASLDIVKEQINSLSNKTQVNNTWSDPYLGFISPTLVGLDFFKIYAYVAATCFKIIAIITDNEMPPSKIRELFENIHELYSRTMCNPLVFNDLGAVSFQKKIEISSVVEDRTVTPLDFVEGITVLDKAIEKMSCILRCNNTDDELIVNDSEENYSKSHDYVERPSVIYKPSTVVPPNNILEIPPPKDLESPITFFPTVDTFFDQDTNTLVTLMELPGFSTSDIEINIGDGELSVSGPRPKEELYEKFGENLSIHIRERKVGFFYRRFKLPNNALDETAVASYENGILSIKIQCCQFSQTRRLEIDSGPITRKPSKGRK